MYAKVDSAWTQKHLWHDTLMPNLNNQIAASVAAVRVELPHTRDWFQLGSVNMVFKQDLNTI